MSRSVYYTTPIYYVNAEPHIGHLYTTVLADTLKRFHTMMGESAYFLTGTDEHGEKIAQVAEKTGEKVEALTARVTRTFQETWKEIGIDNDDFIHTTEPRHVAFVQEVLQQVYDAGDIYFDEYTGLYCVGCERYLTETELEDGLCPDHKTAPKPVKEANYFFRMSKYQDALIKHIENNPGWIRPKRFENEVMSFLKQPLDDLCISRPKTRLTWGIELPFDDKFVTYVWFDALLNYITGLKKGSDGQDRFDALWPVCNHLVAKDIIKTHGIYWPTMLLSAKLHEQALPKHIDVHGYWLSGESKMSKSLGNVVRPLTFDRHFGIENLRYYFFTEMKFGQDAGFTYEMFVERYNAELANGLGNLLSRVSAIVKKNLDGRIPDEPAFESAENNLSQLCMGVALAYPDQFNDRQFHKSLEGIRQILSLTDKYINDMQPWHLAKDPEKLDDLKKVLYTGLAAVRVVTILLSPIMPNTCRKILDYLGETRLLDGSVSFSDLVVFNGLKSGFVLGEVPRAFPRIDEKKLKAVLKEAEAETAAAQKAVADKKANTPAPIGEEITIDDFSKVDLRVGVVKEADLVEGAKKLIKLMVDLGEEKPRQIFAGIRSAYPDPKVLLGKQVIVVANLKPRQMKFGLSEGMVLAGGGGTERLETAGFLGAVNPGDKVS